jgi:hypothetical protein
MTESGTGKPALAPRFNWWVAITLIALITMTHGVFGLLYATRISPQAGHGLLSISGDAYLQSFHGWNTDNEQDATGFNRTAVSILHTGLPYSRHGTLILRTVVYSYFVAICYAIGGIRFLPVLIAQAILSGLAGAVLADAASRLCGGRIAASFIVAALYLMNLRVAMYAGYIVPVILTLFFLSIAFWSIAGSTKDSLPRWVALPLILGVYTSSTFFVVALVGAVWLFLRRRAKIQAAAIVLFVALKFVITWSNVAGRVAEPNRAADRGGIFWLSNNPYYDRMRPWSLWEWRGANPWSTWKMSDEERERYADYLARSGQNELRAALLWIRENPGHYSQVCLARLRTEFSPYTGEMSPRSRLISTAVWLLVFPAGFYALWRRRHMDSTEFVLWMVSAVFAFATFVTEEPYLRYRVPVDLLLTAFAGLIYCEWLAGLRRANPSNAEGG